MSKQDRQGARTVTDLERKYNLQNYGEQFAVVLGIATDARKATEELEERLQSEIEAVRNEITKNNEGILLKSEFETFQDTVTAELALKVGKTDSEEIISMLEAYADEIKLMSNTLVISSDNFSLTRTGEAIMTSALIDNAEITNATITNSEAGRTEILSAKISNADIDSGKITNADIENCNIKNATIEFDDVDTAIIKKANISESYIGNVYFDKFSSRTDVQMRFTDLGMIISEQNKSADNYTCFVWENINGDKVIRMRALDSKLYLEGLDIDGWAHNATKADLVVFGMSIREMYNKIQELSGGGLTQSLDISYDKATNTLSWNRIDGATLYVLYIDGKLVEETDRLSYKTSLGAGDHTAYVIATESSDGAALSRSDTITFTVEEEEEEQKLNLDSYTDSKGNIWLKWNAINGASIYTIKVYYQGEIESIDFATTDKLQKNMADFKLYNGTYDVSVMASDNDGSLASEKISSITIANRTISVWATTGATGTVIHWDGVDLDILWRYYVSLCDSNGKFVDAKSVYNTTEINISAFDIGSDTYTVEVRVDASTGETLANGETTVKISAVGNDTPSACQHKNTEEQGNKIDDCHTEYAIMCKDCGAWVGSRTETHHTGVADNGYCNTCGEYAGG